MTWRELQKLVSAVKAQHKDMTVYFVESRWDDEHRVHGVRFDETVEENIPREWGQISEEEAQVAVPEGHPCLRADYGDQVTWRELEKRIAALKDEYKEEDVYFDPCTDEGYCSCVEFVAAAEKNIGDEGCADEGDIAVPRGCPYLN